MRYVYHTWNPMGQIKKTLRTKSIQPTFNSSALSIPTQKKKKFAQANMKQ